MPAPQSQNNNSAGANGRSAGDGGGSDSAASLVRYLVSPLLDNPDELSVNAVVGDASLLLELNVHDDDRGNVRGEGGRTLRAIQQVLAIAGGSRKPVLDLIDAAPAAAEEDASIEDAPTEEASAEDAPAEDASADEAADTEPDADDGTPSGE